MSSFVSQSMFHVHGSVGQYYLDYLHIFKSAAVVNSMASKFKLDKMVCTLKWFSGTFGTTPARISFFTEEFLDCLAATP